MLLGGVSTPDRPDLLWDERVAQAAESALAEFEAIELKYDFIAEGKSAFENYLDDFEAHGGNLNEAMRFVWYVETADSLNRLDRSFRHSKVERY